MAEPVNLEIGNLVIRDCPSGAIATVFGNLRKLTIFLRK